MEKYYPNILWSLLIHMLRGTLHPDVQQWQSIEVHRTTSSSLSSFLTEFKIPWSLLLCLFIQYPECPPPATKYPPKIIKKSHWLFLSPKHMERTPCAASTFTVAGGELWHHLFCRRVLWVVTPKGPPSLPVLQSCKVLTVIKLVKCGRKFTGWYTTAKSSVKLLGMTKNEGTQRLKHLSEVARRKGRTLAPEKLHQLSACKYLQNSTQPSEIDYVHLRQ